MDERRPIQFTLATLLAAITLAATLLAAYLGGAHLLGPPGGITYAVFAALFGMLAARAWGEPASWRFVLLVGLALPLVFGLSYPGTVFPDFQHFIEREQQARTARAQLAELFASEPAFADLGVTTRNHKLLFVEVHGAVPTRDDLDRLRSLVQQNCSFAEHSVLHWRVTARDLGQTYVGYQDDPLVVQ